MMASYKSCVVCVLLCMVYAAVISVKILGTIESSDSYTTEVELSEYVNGDKWDKTKNVHLNRLVDGETLPSLTLANFNALSWLKIINISLEHVPVFENVSSYVIRIKETKIQYVPINAFHGARVRVLWLDKNEIQTIYDRSINVDVKHLNLYCNRIRVFSQTWFAEPTSIQELHLSGNQIEYIQDRAFSQMTSLATLTLSDNQITRIGSEAFSPGITHLFLDFNDLEQFTLDMFTGRDQRMYELYLHHNLLSFLPEALLLNLTPRKISLDGNPWQCQCLRDIERWLREQNINRYYMPDRRDEPVCVVPLSFQNVCVQNVDKELQQTYARGQSPLPEHLVRGCNQS